MLIPNSWLSRAELSTCSPSPRILPRLIYLSHQFSFYALGEDYHALVRSAHLDVPASKIEVRKTIEVSAFAIVLHPSDRESSRAMFDENCSYIVRCRCQAAVDYFNLSGGKRT